MNRMNVSRSVTAVSVALACCFLTEGISAQSGLRLELNPLEWRSNTGRDYHVFDTNIQVAVGTAVISTRSPNNERFFLTLSPQQGGESQRYLSGSAGRLAYGLYRDATLSQALMPLPLARESTVIAGVVAESDAGICLPVFVSLPANQKVPPGNYSDLIELTLYRGTLADYTEQGTVIWTVTVAVAPVIEYAIVDRGSNFTPHRTQMTLDFDMLWDRRTLFADLLIRGNVGFSVSLRSFHGGVMCNTRGDKLPYEFRYAASMVNLSGDEGAHLLSVTESLVEVLRFPLAITAIPSATQASGHYSDYITLTLGADP